LTSREANIVTEDKEGGFKIDNKIRRNIKYPVGVMDILTVVKTNESYRMLYDVKGRFILNKIKDT
jgi:small subunit ribosomal protein S4e